MPQERHKLLSRLIDRSINTSVALVFVLAAATLSAAFGLLTAQHRLADAYRTMIAADTISGEVQAMRLSMAGWLLRGDGAARSEWLRLAHDAGGDLSALEHRAPSDPAGQALIAGVAAHLADRIRSASPLLAGQGTETGAALFAQTTGGTYQAQNTALADALGRLRNYQTARIEDLQRGEHEVLLIAGVVLLALVAWAALNLRRSHRTARALVRSLQDAFRAVERGRAELTAFNDAAPLAVFHTNLSGIPVWMNAQATRWLSASTPGAVPARLRHLLHPADRERVTGAWGHLVRGAGRFDQVFRLGSEADAPRWAEAHAVPVRVDGMTTGFIAVVQDVTATRILQEELGRSRTRLQRMTDAVPALMAHLDETETYQFVNATYVNWFGSAAPRVGSTIREFLGEAGYPRLKPSIDGVLAGRSVRLEMAQDNLHGMAFVGDVTYTPEFDETGRVCGFYVLVTDVTERKRLEDGLYAAKEMAQVTLDSLGDAVITTDERGFVTFLNKRAELLLEPRARRALGQHVDEVVHLVDGLGRPGQTSLGRAILEERLVDVAAPRKLALSDGTDLDIEDVAAPIRMRDGAVVGGVLVLRDVSVAQAVADRMRHLAESDALTGLPNRLVFDERLSRALQHRTGSNHVVVLFMDLDGFKAVNDVHGHVAGDALLREVASRLARNAAPGDTVCRLGGDEFVALLAAPIDARTAIDRARTFIDVASEPCGWNETTLQVTLSVGIAVSPDHGRDSLNLLRMADVALYEAKQAGKNQVRLYGTAGAQ